jgi:hypothetical protein
MYCPSCLSPNDAGEKVCQHCHAELGDARQRLSLGNQFLFVDASPRHPVALDIDGQGPARLDGPAIFSRHCHRIRFGDLGTGPLWDRGRRRPGADLPPLAPPNSPNLLAVVTDRRIYRPHDEVHIFIVAPDEAGGEVEMEVQLAGQQITKEKVPLDDAGLALRPLAGLEEGEYTVSVRSSGFSRSSRSSGSARPPAQCTFSVAEFALSPVIARLERHTYDAGRLSFRLNVVALSVPYDGPIELALQSGPAAAGRVVATQKATVRQGSVEAAFDVREHEGPFRVQLTTPDGETASVFFPGTGRTERERITICPLGTVAEAGLLPGEDTVEVRGLHVGYDGVELTPLRLEGAVGRTGRLVADVRAAVVQVVTFDPLGSETSVYEWRDVSPGDAFEFPVESPYTLFTAGLLGPRQPYEAWGVVVRPADVVASLTAPAQAQPGAEIAVRVETDWPASCLLLVYDARLEHESPVPKMAKRLLEAIRAATLDLKEQAAPSLDSAVSWNSWYWFRSGRLEDLRLTRAEASRSAFLSRRPVAPTAGVSDAPLLDIPAFRRDRSALQARGASPLGAGVAETDTLTWLAAPSREDFPEMGHLELFPVDHVVERTVALGDQIGTWRCRAYLVYGLDLLELTADVEAAKAVYAELDLPAIVGPGDDILAAVHYHTAGPATMSITLPGGQTVSGAVVGHGSERIHLTEPGEVTVHISGEAGDDWTARTIPPPGVQTVTASRLEILKKGETVVADRVVVYPGPTDVLKDTIEALGRYPFG